MVLARMYECRLNGYCAAKPCICNGTVRNASITGSQSAFRTLASSIDTLIQVQCRSQAALYRSEDIVRQNTNPPGEL